MSILSGTRPPTSHPSTSLPRGASRRRTAIIVGGLFVVQMVTAMIGSALIQGFLDGQNGRGQLTAGVALMMTAGFVVVGIGLLMYPILAEVDPRRAAWYPALRIAECLVSVVCGAYLLARLEVVPNHMLWVYVPTGLGGIVLTYLLLVSRLVPLAIALLGLVGYAVLTLGVPLDLVGVLDMNDGPGLLLLGPGGLFEVVLLPIWLIAKGFGEPRRPGSVTPWTR